jgi:heat shock protein HslJ
MRDASGRSAAVRPRAVLTEPAAAFIASHQRPASAAAAPENMMIRGRLVGGAFGLARALRSIGLVAALLAPSVAMAAEEFPYDREMIMDAQRMGGLKRLPILIVDPDGKAVIDLWCQTVPGRVQVTDRSIKIEAAPLPEQLPAMMVAGQCSPERMQADRDLLAALLAVTEWHRQNGMLVLSGPSTLRFHASSH